MAETTTPRAPQYLSKGSRAFWRHVIGVYEFEPHHVKLLTLLCEALDRGERARQAIASDGAYLPDRFGQLKAHPAVAVERHARIAAVRLTRELDLDGSPEPDPRPPRHPSVRLAANGGG
jgi:phage terminase small subunit